MNAEDLEIDVMVFFLVDVSDCGVRINRDVTCLIDHHYSIDYIETCEFHDMPDSFFQYNQLTSLDRNMCLKISTVQ